jgi:hypothetical protein
VRCTKPLEHQAFGYANNEDQRLVEALLDGLHEAPPRRCARLVFEKPGGAANRSARKETTEVMRVPPRKINSPIPAP